MYLSLALPCRNEELAIPSVLSQVLKLKKELEELDSIDKLEILVLNDHSTDQSLSLLEKRKDFIKVISFEKQQGYGAVLKKGFQESKGDWFAFCDLDDSYQVLDLKNLIQLAQEKSLNIVWGNRLNKKSRIPRVRHLGNQIYRILFFLLTFKKTPDPCSGFRLLKKSEFQAVIPKLPNDLSFTIALTAYCIRRQTPFDTVDISYKERKGQSKLHVFKDGWIFLFQALKFLFIK